MTAPRAIAVAFLLLAPLLGGCETQYDTRGHVAEPGTMEKLKPEGQTKEEILRTLGSPSAVATFDTETWYYITQKTKTELFFKPELLEQSVTVIKFNQAGTVAEMKVYNKDDAEAVAMVDRTTTTEGKELTFFDQVFANLGRFSNPAGGGIGSGRRPPGGGL